MNQILTFLPFCVVRLEWPGNIYIYVYMLVVCAIFSHRNNIFVSDYYKSDMIPVCTLVLLKK